MGLTRAEAAYTEATRATAGQLEAWVEIRTRANTLLAAAALVTSFLGTAALGGREPEFDRLAWAAIVAFVLCVGFCLAVLWPRRDAWDDHVPVLPLLGISDEDAATRLHFKADEARLPTRIEKEDKRYPDDPQELRARIALELEKYWHRNNDVLAGVYKLYTVASGLLIIDVLLWTAKLAS